MSRRGSVNDGCARMRGDVVRLVIPRCSLAPPAAAARARQRLAPPDFDYFGEATFRRIPLTSETRRAKRVIVFLYPPNNHEAFHSSLPPKGAAGAAHSKTWRRYFAPCGRGSEFENSNVPIKAGLIGFD